MRKLLVITTCLWSLTMNMTAQHALDDIDRRAWADVVSPLERTGYTMRDISSSLVSSRPTNRQISLSGTWKLTGNGVEVRANVPGSIHTALMDAGVIPDPRIGRNDSMAERCSYQSWTLEREFEYDGTFSNPLLSFKGIANRCNIWLNGRMIASHEGMFGGPDVAVGKYLRRGTNHLKVELLPIPETYNGGWPATANEAWKHTVVANCVYGWHYAKIPSMGIWNEVVIIDRPHQRLEHPFILTRDIEGDMRLLLTLPEKVSGDIRLLVTPENFNGESQAFQTTVKGAKGDIALDFTIRHPQLWWPNDVGRQPLYRAEMQLVSDGRVLYSCSNRFGIRTIEMRPFPQGAQEDLYNWTFCVNGRQMFVKGTGWCTMDALLDFRRDRYERLLTTARDQHVQLLRAWGGGLPETDTFYDLCDELGIMVIQEWPTAWNSHETQPYDMLRETVTLNTLRLRNHPSLVMWGGGNESDKPYGRAIDMMGRISVELDGTRPFHRAEAWGGSRHDYTCWWDKAPLSHNLTMTAPFWGEFGIASLPHMESVRRYLQGERYEWPPQPSSTFTHHTPIFGTNGEIERLGQYAGSFMPLTTLENVVLGSQLSQVVGVRHTLERARTLWPQTTGALYYKLNDNYPGLSWSSVDYFGAIKPLHYFAKRAFEPIQTVLLLDSTNLAGQNVRLPYYLLDDYGHLTGQRVKAHLTVWNHQMVCVADTLISITPHQQVERLADISLNAKQTTSEMLYLKTDLLDGTGMLLARNWYFTNYESKQGCLLASKPSQVTMTQEGDRLILSNSSDYPAVGVTVSVPGEADRLSVTDNYLWIDGGETVTVTMNTTTRAVVDWWNRDRASMLTSTTEPFGVNIACGDFGSRFPGEYNKDYTYPTDRDLEYWQQKGLMLVRIPFRWERLQHDPNGPLCQKDLQHVKDFIAVAERRGMSVVLDMHNYCRRIDNGKERIIGTPDLSYESYGRFWRMMAEALVDYSNIYGYGLMNEPHDLPPTVSWQKMAQTAIDSIRTVDDMTPIVVGGYHWSSARRWVQMSDHLKTLQDKADRLIFEAHCYFDFDGSGTYKFTYEQEEGSPTKGVELVRPFVEWLNKNHLRGIVGEYGIPENDPRWEVTLDNFLFYLAKNGVPALYWASGPWWTDAVMTIPTYRGGAEKPQVRVMERYRRTGTELHHGLLRVNATQRYLEHEDGTPFLYLADTAWELLARLTYDEACRYLDNRADKGFTVIQTVVLTELDGMTEATPRYLEHVDSVLAYAEQKGLYMAILPTWGDKVDKQWGQGPVVFDESSAREYGIQLGQRWAARRNIIWVMGGDRSGEGRNHAVWTALAQGIRSVDQNHLMTYHPHGEHSSSMWFHQDDWLDFNMIQSGHFQYSYDIYRRLLLPDTRLKPTKPVMDGEPRYEDIPRSFQTENGRFTAKDVRRSLYQSMLSGACGYTYGNNSIWQMYAPGREPQTGATRYWYDALDMDGACQLAHFVDLWNFLPFGEGHHLPDCLKPTDGYQDDEAVAFGAREFMVCYFPGGSRWRLSLPLDMKGSYKLTWVNPRSGIWTPSGISRRQQLDIVLPDTDGKAEDWVLLLQKEIKK